MALLEREFEQGIGIYLESDHTKSDVCYIGSSDVVSVDYIIGVVKEKI